MIKIKIRKKNLGFRNMKEKLEIIVLNFSFQVQDASQPIAVQTKTQYVNSHGSLTANCLMNVPMNRIQMESKYTPLFDISKEDIIYMDRGQKSSRNNEQRSSFINYSLLKDWGPKQVTIYFPIFYLVKISCLLSAF